MKPLHVLTIQTNHLNPYPLNLYSSSTLAVVIPGFAVKYWGHKNFFWVMALNKISNNPVPRLKSVHQFP